MPCAHCISADKLFDTRTARRELDKLHRRGPSRSTAKLLALVPRGSLLDIGGGVGAIQQAFVPEAERITHVDASHAYLHVAAEELRRMGYTHGHQLFGDFVELADEVPVHDVVTLDRVLCCYPDLDALASASLDKAGKAWAVVFPKERWWMKAGMALVNLAMRLWGSDYRAYVHPEARVRQLAEERGFRLAGRDATLVWLVWSFERAT